MGRKIISISIREDLLIKLDEMIDGTVIRNRSHALETVLVNYFHEEKVQVLILAGGPQDVDLKKNLNAPQCMREIGGKPVLAHILENLKTLGVQKVNISVGDNANAIIEYFGDGSEYGININYIRETEPVGTAGAILKSKRYLTRRFVVIYGDNLFKFDLMDMVDFHEKNKAFATVGLTSVPDPSTYGVVSLKGTKIVDYKEKPEITNSYIINAGIYVFEQEVFNYLTPNARSLERDVLPQLAAEGKLCGYTLAGPWFPLDTEEGYKAAKRFFESKSR